MKPINWKLTELFPSTAGNLFAVVNDWSKHNVFRTLDQPLQTNRLRRIMAVERLDRAETGETSRWRTSLGVALLKVKQLIEERATFVGASMDKMSKEYNKLWLSRNCRPSGGNWKPDMKLNPANPTGKPCCSKLCPWCHLRRMNDYVNMLTAPAGTEVKTFSGTKTIGLGLGDRVNMVSFVIHGTLKDGSDLLSSDKLDILLKRADEAVKGNAKSGSEFTTALKVLVPIYCQVGTNKVGGWRVSYIHNTPQAEERMTFDRLGSIEVHRFQNMKLSDAVVIAAQFPIDVLDKHAPQEIIKQFTEALEGKRSFTTKEFKQNKTAAIDAAA